MGVVGFMAIILYFPKKGVIMIKKGVVSSFISIIFLSLFLTTVKAENKKTESLAVGTPCEYIPGDVNGSSTVSGGDVTYAVRYFKGLGPAPPFICPYCPGLYPAGDANGNCAFTGSDITYLVAYFKGVNPSVHYCTDCPPIGR